MQWLADLFQRHCPWQPGCVEAQRCGGQLFEQRNVYDMETVGRKLFDCAAGLKLNKGSAERVEIKSEPVRNDAAVQ